MKTTIAILFSLIVVAVSAALILPSFVDWNQYKGDITDQANKATGRRLTIFGDISLAVLPSPTLKVADVRLANTPGGDAQNMVSLKALEVHVALWPLLSSELQVQSIRLIEPVIALEVDKDGLANWDFGRAGGSASGGEEESVLAGFSLDSLFIEKGSLTFSDATSGFSERIDGLTTEISAKSLEGPFIAKGKVTTHGLALGFDANIGRIAAGAALPLTLDLEVGKGTGKVSIKGLLSRPDATGEFKGKVSVSGAEAMALVREVTAAVGAPVTDISGLKQSISLRSDVIATAAELGLNNLELKLGETTATGAINATLGATRQVDVALDVNRVDLNSWIPPEAAETDKPDQPDVKQEAAGEPFAIPTDLSGTLNINVNALAFKGASIRQFETSASIAGGVITIERVAAHLPGGAAVDVVGTIASVKGLPQFEGGVRASADNLRGLLSWVGVDLSDIPTDRLRGTSLSATVRGTPELLEIYGIDLRLDSSTLSGGAAFAIRTRPAFSVDFANEQLNVDAYRASPNATTADKSTDGSDTSVSELSALPPEVIDVLNSFDTNVKVAFRKLNLNAVPIKGVVVDVGLLGGAVTVRDIKADDLGGATFSFKGDARELGTKPRLNGVIDIQAANATGLARLANVVLPVPAERLGAVRATGKIAGNTEGLDLDLKVLAAKTTTGLTGKINLAKAATRLNLTLKADNKSYVDLWRVFDPEFELAPGGRDGPLAISGTMAGDLNTLGVDLKVGFGKANLTAAGKLSPTGSATTAGPMYNLALKAAHPDAPAFLQGLGIDYHPATTNFGALALSADISGTTGLVQIGNLDGKFGPVATAGSISAQIDGRRPLINANLVTSEILVDLFLPRSNGAAKSTSSQSGGERWSTNPINLEGLNSIDLVLDLQSKGITYGAYRFANPQVKATIRDGVLNIKPLTGQLFDGAVNLTAELRDDQVPTVNMSIDLSGANIHEALVKAAGVEAVTGQAGFNGQFSAVGHSQKAMISRLSGKANFAAENGIVQGVDLQRLSDRLKTLDKTVDFLSLINATMNGGETAYSRLGGTFNVQNGVARSDDLSATLQAGAGSGRAVVDLPRWLVDMTASFRLTEHPKAPPIGLVLRGPLDAPQRDVKSKDMENFVAKRVGGTLIRKLLGKKAGGLGSLLTGGGTTQDAAPPPSQPVQQQQLQPPDGLAPPPILLPQEPEQQPQPGNVKPKDVLKGLLKGLIK